MIEVSLFDDNLRPFLTAVGWLVGHRFDEGDWAATSQGIRGTDAEAGRWFEYEFNEGRRAGFSVAYDEDGTSVVRFRADLPAEFEARIRLLGDFCCHFHWSGPME